MCLLMTKWLKHGTYCVVRRIQYIETWDRTALEEQEATFGRKRHSGAPLTGGKEFDEIDLKRKIVMASILLIKMPIRG